MNKPSSLLLVISLCASVRCAAQPVAPVLVSDANGLAFREIKDLLPWNGKLYFLAEAGFTDVYKRLWSSDGTLAGTAAVADPFTVPTPHPFSYLNELYTLPNTLIIQREYGELTAYNGNSAPVQLKPRGTFFSGDGVVLNGQLFFSSEDNDRELWVTNGTAAGTFQFKNLNLSGPSYPSSLCLGNNKFFFSAYTAGSGTELYVSDGSPNGTSLLKDIVPGSVGSYPKALCFKGGKLYFVAQSVSGNWEPYISDGTTAGTKLLKEVNPSTTVGSDPSGFTALGNKVFFAANDGTNGTELWVTDGTTAGTNLFRNIVTGSTGSNPHSLMVYNSKLYFGAVAGFLPGREGLWATDGLKTNTQVADATAPTSKICSPVALASGLLFYTTKDDAKSALWVTSGTTPARQIVPDVAPNLKPTISNFAVLNNALYFTANFQNVDEVKLYKVLLY